MCPTDSPPDDQLLSSSIKYRWLSLCTCTVGGVFEVICACELDPDHPLYAPNDQLPSSLTQFLVNPILHLQMEWADT
jgi:hypothetical protein